MEYFGTRPLIPLLGSRKSDACLGGAKFPLSSPIRRLSSRPSDSDDPDQVFENANSSLSLIDPKAI